MQPALLDLKNVPDYLVNNEFIISGYRADWNWRDSLWSLVGWHNETLNIWTHFAGFICFAILTHGLATRIPEVPVGEAAIGHITVRWPFFVFLLGAKVCLGISTFCHTFHCVSKGVCAVVWRFDYFGIAFLIATSFFPVVYYAFLCHPAWQVFYLVSISSLGIMVSAVSLLDRFQAAEYIQLRAGLFAGMGLMGFIPMIHQTFVNWDSPAMLRMWGYELLMGVLYLIGTAAYALKWPERHFPGKLDIVGHSHQIFHVFVVLGALVHYHGAVMLLEWRDSEGGHAKCLPPFAVPGGGQGY